MSERHLYVVSDLHLGSPVADAERDLLRFIDFVGAQGAGLCINGDCFDLLQSRGPVLLGRALPIIRRLTRIHESGSSLFYTIGNHDLALEHLLLDLPIAVAPFLNLTSGTSRIRIEHGHVYEPFYAKHPDLYEFGGRLARFLLFLSTDVYRVWSSWQERVDQRRRRTGEYPHHEAASDLFARGFDAVILGHTHHPERSELDDGLFVNAGDWLGHRTVVEIDEGAISLLEWDGHRLVRPG